MILNFNLAVVQPTIPQNTTSTNPIDDLLGLGFSQDLSKSNVPSSMNTTDIFGATTSPPTIAGFGTDTFAGGDMGRLYSTPVVSNLQSNSLFGDLSLNSAQSPFGQLTTSNSLPHEVGF